MGIEAADNNPEKKEYKTGVIQTWITRMFSNYSNNLLKILPTLDLGNSSLKLMLLGTL
jgi:hypothetical protein